MLRLTRRTGDTILAGPVEFEILDTCGACQVCRCNRVSDVLVEVGIIAPKEVPILRGELHQRNPERFDPKNWRYIGP